MPQPRTKRKAEPDPEEPEGRADDVSDEEMDEDVDQDPGTEGLNIDVADDRVVIELPRDGNERPTLEAIGAMLESMS